MECNFCEGVAHPASGCSYTETMIACGPCVRRFWSWFEEHSTPRPIRNRCSQFEGDVPWKNVPMGVGIRCFDIFDIETAPRKNRCCMSTTSVRCTRSKPKVISFYGPG